MSGGTEEDEEGRSACSHSTRDAFLFIDIQAMLCFEFPSRVAATTQVLQLIKYASCDTIMEYDASHSMVMVKESTEDIGEYNPSQDVQDASHARHFCGSGMIRSRLQDSCDVKERSSLQEIVRRDNGLHQLG